MGYLNATKSGFRYDKYEKVNSYGNTLCAMKKQIGGNIANSQINLHPCSNGRLRFTFKPLKLRPPLGR